MDGEGGLLVKDSYLGNCKLEFLIISWAFVADSFSLASSFSKYD